MNSHEKSKEIHDSPEIWGEKEVKNNMKVQNKNSGRYNNDGTQVGVGVSYMGFGIHANVKNNHQCPPGYYWVNTYVKKTFWRSIKVQGHCRKAGSWEQQQQAMWEQQQKQKMMKLEIKKAKILAKANKKKK